MQKIDCLKSVARNLRCLVVDAQVSSLTGSTIDALALLHAQSGRLVGKTAYLYSGAGLGQERVVGSYDPAYHRLCFPQVFVSMPSLNTNFILLENFNKSECDNAIERAIGAANLEYLQKSVATLALVATQYEYAVPSGFEYVQTLRLVPSSNTDYGLDSDTETYFDLPMYYWRLEKNAVGTPMIAFDPRRIDMAEFDAHWVKVVGQSKAAITATDNATIPVDLEEYVTTKATANLCGQLGAEWKERFRYYANEASKLEQHVHRPRFGKKVW